MAMETHALAMLAISRSSTAVSTFRQPIVRNRQQPRTAAAT
jgi:hypothetical protein